MGGETEVLLFMIDAGGGHRAAARALVAAAEEVQAPFTLRVENYQRLLLGLDPLHRFTGLSLEDAYNLILRRRWNSAMVPLMRLMHGVIRLLRPAIRRALTAWLAARARPAAVVSVMPHFNGITADALRAAHPGVPLVVVLTDFADFPPRFWIEPGIDRVVVGSDEAREQAVALGLAPERVSRVSGMILRPGFYRASGPEARARMRAELGLGEEDFAVMLLFGGKGSPEMPRLADALLAADTKARVVAVCGDNPELVARMREVEGRAGGRLTSLGFSDRIAELLAASDLLVTKPGPGSLAEAFHARVPVVVTRNRHTIPQERFNTDFVKRHGLGLVVRHWSEIPGAVARLRADPAERAAIRARIAALPANHAVYEVLDIVAREAGLVPAAR
jgi:UDP-N-acetylglucosamine:LPS N-acetylglucosamine transferase